MDVTTNLPVKIDVFEIKDVTSNKLAQEIKSNLKFTYPDSFNMTDLSPSSYNEFVNRMQASEKLTLDFNT